MGMDCGAEVAEWLTCVLGRRCRLVRQNPYQKRSSKQKHKWSQQAPNEDGLPPPLSLANEAQYLLLSQGSLEQLLKEMRETRTDWTAMDSCQLASRFRANFVVSGEDMEPYEEENWKKIRIGYHLFLVSLSDQYPCWVTAIS